MGLEEAESAVLDLNQIPDIEMRERRRGGRRRGGRGRVNGQNVTQIQLGT